MLGYPALPFKPAIKNARSLGLTILLAGESADGDRSWAFIEAALPVYRLLGAEESIGWLNHRQGHRHPPAARAAAEAFLDRHLKPEKSEP